MECFDWTVPKEWNIREAWIKDLQGRVIVDFSENNLHILNYSLPKQGRIRREELLAHLYSREDLPDAIQQPVTINRIGNSVKSIRGWRSSLNRSMR